MPIDYDYQDICFKCNQEGCIRCSGTISNNICLECHPNYKLFEGQCVENCDIGDEFKCLTCNESQEKIIDAKLAMIFIIYRHIPQIYIKI